MKRDVSDSSTDEPREDEAAALEMVAAPSKEHSIEEEMAPIISSKEHPIEEEVALISSEKEVANSTNEPLEDKPSVQEMVDDGMKDNCLEENEPPEDKPSVQEMVNDGM